MSDSIGQIGERAAEAYLLKNGHLTRERNFTRRPFGEIDIVSQVAGTLCFTEVKTSLFVEGSGFTPEIRVNRRKIRRLKRICEVYLRENNLLDRNWRIDVISVILGKDNSVLKLEHFENAVFRSKY